MLNYTKNPIIYPVLQYEKHIMFSSLFTRNNISVKLIEAVSNESFAQIKMNAGQLPPVLPLLLFFYDNEDISTVLATYNLLLVY